MSKTVPKMFFVVVFFVMQRSGPSINEIDFFFKQHTLTFGVSKQQTGQNETSVYSDCHGVQGGLTHWTSGIDAHKRIY